MLYLSVLNNLVLIILVLTASYKIHAAPTHHLTIGVQGKTPTLIVTSSEIGITPQTIDSNKNGLKAEYVEKSLKDSDVLKKPNKTRLYKNQTLFNKNNKNQHLAKAVTKPTITEANELNLTKHVQLKENANNTTFKLSPITTVLLGDQETTTSNLDALEITTTSPVTDVTADNIDLYTTNIQFTTLIPKQITENPINLFTTTRFHSTQNEEMSTLTPQVMADTTTAPFVISDADNINIFSVMAANLNPKDLDEITSTINYNDNQKVATTSGVLIQTQAEAKVNDVVVQADKSIIKMENEDDSDRHTQESIATTENPNLLLTTIETNAFATPATNVATSTPTLDSLITEKAVPTTTSESLSLSLTMTTTTTENIVDNINNNNEQQQPATMHLDKSIHGLKKGPDDKEHKDNVAANPSKSKNRKIDAILKAGQDDMYTTTATQQTNEEHKSTENPIANKIIQTTYGSVFNETTNGYTENKVEIETTTTPERMIATQPTLTTERPEQELATLKTSQKQKISITTTSKSPDQAYESSNTPTTEAVLKLIDLEKHVVKTIDELKQPSSLMTGQHDNGHDGLKNIRKKQLADKHYVEALLHNKQDVHVKHSLGDKKDLTQTAQVTERTTVFPPNNNDSIAVSNKPVLMPIKHGYLGPILMEEKTFHVIHHTDNNMTDRNHHVDDIESEMRRGHFVELKVKKDIADREKEMKILKNKNMKGSSTDDKEIMEMQSDQPIEISDKQNVKISLQKKEQKSSLKDVYNIKDNKPVSQKATTHLSSTSGKPKVPINNKLIADNLEVKNSQNYTNSPLKSLRTPEPEVPEISVTENLLKSSLQLNSNTQLQHSLSETTYKTKPQNKSATVLSTTIFQVIDSVATKTPIVQADTLFNAEDKTNSYANEAGKQQVESKISDIQIEVYDSTVDAIVASTNFKDIEPKQETLQTHNDDSYLGKTTKPPVAPIQQERFTQYVIDRIETSTHEPINYNTIRVASGRPEPAAIEIHINVSESFGNESEDVELSYPQTQDISNNNNNERIAEESYDDGRVNENIKLKIPSYSNGNGNGNGKELEKEEILVVEIIDTDNDTNTAFKGKSKIADELFITDVKDIYTSPPPPPPPPPYQTNFDRDSDTIFYISNTEVKVGESLPKNSNEERKLQLEAQFFPANYVASTHPSLSNTEDLHPTHHLYEEDIILSPSRNHADSLKIYRNNNEPSPPLDVTYVGESIIEVEQSPESIITTTYATDRQHYVATPQADVIIQPAILPEISIGVPVIGELPPQIEIKEIDFMPNEAQLHRSGVFDDNDDDDDNNNISNNDIDENTINGSNDNNHDVDIASGNSNKKLRVDESSIQYGGDLIDESADGGFDGVEGSYPFGNPAVVDKSSAYSYSSGFLTKLRKQQQEQKKQMQKQQHKPNHVADYTHLYVNYGVNNMRKDDLNADVKEPEEMLLIGNGGGSGNINVLSSEQNTTSFKDFLSKVSMSNSTMPFINSNSSHTERMSNATAFTVMEDAYDLENKNTEDIVNLISLAIGLLIVILPVVATCSMFWALRCLYKKYHSNLIGNGGYTDQTDTKSPLNENGVEKGEFAHEPSSSFTNSYKETIEKYQYTSNKPSITNSNINFSSEKSDLHLDIIPSNTNTTITYSSSAIVSKKLSLTLTSSMAQKQTETPPSTSPTLLVVTTSEHRNNVHGDVVSKEDDDNHNVKIKGPNGSITKMTMKNNLLIVETEERNDMSRVARETKMDYNKKGVFVVEVARGIDSKTIPESPVTEGNDKMLSMFDTKQNNGGLELRMTNEKNCASNEKVQIHLPPSENPEEGPRSLHQIEEVEEPVNSPRLNEVNDGISDVVYKANTGLSQSDLSSTSSSDSNKGYCYGNQALYVVEQTDYSTNRPNGNVVLKCDIKDIKDDDHNPGNDHYLEHSPERNEELNKNKEDIVESFKKSDEGESRKSSRESPDQKQNDKVKDKLENTAFIENSPSIMESKEQGLDIYEKETSKDQLKNSNKAANCNSPTKIESAAEISKQMQKYAIAVEIEVHITPAQDDNTTEDTILSSIKSTIEEESPALEENENKSQPSISASIHEIVEDSFTIKTPFESGGLQEKQQVTANNTPVEINISLVPDKLANNEASQHAVSSISVLPAKAHGETINKNVDKLEIIEEKSVLETAEINEKQFKDENGETLNGVEKKQPILSSLNSLEINGNLGNMEQESANNQGCDIVLENGLKNITLHDLTKSIDTEGIEEKNALNCRDVEHNTNYPDATTQSESLTNGTPAIFDQLENGQMEEECNGNSTSEMGNGYDSILSLPEPPPTTDEQPNNDLSDQQLDSLPPPPPPEIFNLKDLPPPLTNGNADFPQNEESTNFYKTLPPPPPTILQVSVSAETTTATNGKVHASPLTPPASPPARFTNNLHAGICSHPIAVDVNGS